MSANEMLSYCKNTMNDGVSVWTATGRNQMSCIKSKPKGIPQFNSNDVYLVLEQKHGHSVLGDKPYTYFKAYFWVGAKATNRENKVEKTLTQLDDVIDSHPVGSAKLRVYIEY